MSMTAIFNNEYNYHLHNMTGLTILDYNIEGGNVASLT